MGALRATAARPSLNVDAHERLIVALDVPTVKEAWEIVRKLDGAVSFYKIGLWLNFAKGFENLLDGLLSMDCDVFMDTKGQDIPETMKAAADGAAKRGIRFLTVHGNGEVSDQAMEAAVAGKSGKLQIFSVTVLTSLDQSDLTKGGDGPMSEVVTERVTKALRCGCDGVIASAHEARMIKKLAREHGKPEFLVTTPGIRPIGAGRNDHKRPATPRFAISEGADYLVVGRPIIHALDPAKVAASIVAEMQDAFDAR